MPYDPRLRDIPSTPIALLPILSSGYDCFLPSWLYSAVFPALGQPEHSLASFCPVDTTVTKKPYWSSASHPPVKTGGLPGVCITRLSGRKYAAGRISE